MQITSNFGPCAAVEYLYVSVEVGHCVKADESGGGKRRTRASHVSGT